MRAARSSTRLVAADVPRRRRSAQRPGRGRVFPRRESRAPPRRRSSRQSRSVAPSTYPDAVDGPAGRLPRVVGRARTERRFVRLDARVTADFLRALRMMEEVRIVALLPDEYEMRGSHEVGNERAAARG